MLQSDAAVEAQAEEAKLAESVKEKEELAKHLHAAGEENDNLKDSLQKQQEAAAKEKVNVQPPCNIIECRKPAQPGAI